MQVPNESLDDFINTDAALKTAEPPSDRSLQLTGKVEVLKPIARSTDLARFRAATGRMILRPEPSPKRNGISWYHRSLALSGAVAFGALLLGIFTWIYTPPEPFVAQNELVQDQPGGIHSYLQNDAATADTFTPSVAPRVSDTRRTARSTERRRTVRTRHRRTAYRSRNAAPVPRMVMSEFVPTTLIIYIENGEVKTRIEPQVPAGHKRKT